MIVLASCGFVAWFLVLGGVPLVINNNCDERACVVESLRGVKLCYPFLKI